MAGGFSPAQSAISAGAAGPKPRQVRADQTFACGVDVDLGRAQPVLRKGVEVGAPPLPGAGGRDPHEVDPHPDAVRAHRVTGDLLDLLARQLAPAHPGRHRPGEPRHLACVGLGRAPAVGEPHLPPELRHRDLERPVVLSRDEVNRRSHQRRLHHGPAPEPAGEGLALESGKARPQSDVHGRRVLGLDPADPLERLGRRELRPLEQQLAGENRAVQLALGEDALGHALTLAGGNAWLAETRVGEPMNEKPRSQRDRKGRRARTDRRCSLRRKHDPDQRRAP